MRELALWVRILDDVTPGLAVTEAGIVVCVALAVIGDAVTTRSLGERPDLADRLTEPGTGLLLGRERRERRGWRGNGSGGSRPDGGRG
ncbi:hypothetical protein ACFVAQ_23685 [Streptomyces sp. NPDC057651]|uniref:hypothetical protein n=1 Tax=unclassified Streptomyces TaxID=2593676 RepID=UPI0036B061A3